MRKLYVVCPLRLPFQFIYEYLIGHPDYTAATILNKFKDDAAAQSVERVLKKLSGEKASQILAVRLCVLFLLQSVTFLGAQTREPRLPSFTFISAYFAAFRSRQCNLSPHTHLYTFLPNAHLTGPPPTLPEEPSTGDQTLLLALQALEAADYTHALTLINESLEQGVSWDAGKAEALNLRGTFKFVSSFPISHLPIHWS